MLMQYEQELADVLVPVRDEEVTTTTTTIITRILEDRETSAVSEQNVMWVLSISEGGVPRGVRGFVALDVLAGPGSSVSRLGH